MAARWPTQNTTVAHITLSETAREIMREQNAFGDGERNYASRPNTTGSAASSRDDGAQAGDGGEGTWRHDGQRRIRRLSETARKIMRVDLIRGARPRAVAMTNHSQAKAANATWRHDGQRA